MSVGPNQWVEERYVNTAAHEVVRLERIRHRTDVTSIHRIVRIDEQEQGASRGCCAPVPQFPSDVTSCPIHDLESKSSLPVLDPTHTRRACR